MQIIKATQYIGNNPSSIQTQSRLTNGALDHEALMYVYQQPLLWQQDHDLDAWHTTTTPFDQDPYSMDLLESQKLNWQDIGVIAHTMSSTVTSNKSTSSSQMQHAMSDEL